MRTPDPADASRATGGRSVPLVVALVANGLVLLGLLFGGWSVWTMLGAFWVELVVEIPLLAYRIGHALPRLPEEEREAYLAQSDREGYNDQTVGSRVRAAWGTGGPEAGGRAASRLFLAFWLPFILFPGGFLFIFGLVFGGLGTWLAAAGPVAIVAAGVFAAELVSLWMEREARPALPDTRGFERRFVVISITAILVGWSIGLFGPHATLVAVIFVGLKTAADVRSGYLPASSVPAPR